MQVESASAVPFPPVAGAGYAPAPAPQGAQPTGISARLTTTVTSGGMNIVPNTTANDGSPLVHMGL